MEVIYGLALAYAAWIVFVYARDAIDRIRQQVVRDFAESSATALRKWLRALVAPAAWSATTSIAYFAAFKVTDGTVMVWGVLFVAIWACVLALYERRAQAIDSDNWKRKQQEAEAARRRELNETGIGWSRHDILQADKKTIFYRSGGVTKPTEGWKCACCGKNIYRRSDAHVDHIKPRSKHATLTTTRSNLQVLCGSCNSHKSDYEGDDWKVVTRRRRRGKPTPGVKRPR